MVEEESGQQPERKKYQSRSFGMLVRLFEPQQQIFFDALHDQERPKKKMPTIVPFLNFFLLATLMDSGGGGGGGSKSAATNQSLATGVLGRRKQKLKTLLQVSCFKYVLLLSLPSCSSKWHEIVFILSHFSTRFQQLVTACTSSSVCGGSM
jgi:hypothetical protein